MGHRPALRNGLLFADSLNLFIDENCHSGFTCMDIDLYLVKISQKRLRFIECKRIGETMSYGQKVAIALWSKLSHPSFDVSAYVVTGNYPFLEGALVERVNGKKQHLTRRELIAWLDFKKEFNEFLVETD